MLLLVYALVTFYLTFPDSCTLHATETPGMISPQKYAILISALSIGYYDCTTQVAMNRAIGKCKEFFHYKTFSGSCFKSEWETAGAYVWVGLLLAGSVGIASLYATVLNLTVQILIVIVFVVVSIVCLVMLEMDYTKRRTRHNTQCSQKSQNENN